MKQLIPVPAAGIKKGDIVYDYRYDKLVKVRYITEHRVLDDDCKKIEKYFAEFMPIDATDDGRDYDECETLYITSELYKLVDVDKMLACTYFTDNDLGE